MRVKNHSIQYRFAKDGRIVDFPSQESAARQSQTTNNKKSAHIGGKFSEYRCMQTTPSPVLCLVCSISLPEQSSRCLRKEKKQRAGAAAHSYATAGYALQHKSSSSSTQPASTPTTASNISKQTANFHTRYFPLSQSLCHNGEQQQHTSVSPQPSLLSHSGADRIC